MPKTKPLTKQDLDIAVNELAEVTNEAFMHADKRMDRMENKIDRIERGVQALLAAAEADAAFRQELRALPDRVARLERTVYR